MINLDHINPSHTLSRYNLITGSKLNKKNYRKRENVPNRIGQEEYNIGRILFSVSLLYSLIKNKYLSVFSPNAGKYGPEKSENGQFSCSEIINNYLIIKNYFHMNNSFIISY